MMEQKIDPESSDSLTATEKDLISLMMYMKAHPNERFWQALRNWSGWSFVWVSDSWESVERENQGLRGGILHDTFYWVSSRRPVGRVDPAPPSNHVISTKQIEEDKDDDDRNDVTAKGE